MASILTNISFSEFRTIQKVSSDVGALILYPLPIVPMNSFLIPSTSEGLTLDLMRENSLVILLSLTDVKTTKFKKSKQKEKKENGEILPTLFMTSF